MLLARLNQAICQINDRHSFKLDPQESGWALVRIENGRIVETKGWGRSLQMLAEARAYVLPWAYLLRYNTNEIILANLEPMNAILDVFGEVAELLGRCEP